jgi:hypothetical protein
MLLNSNSTKNVADGGIRKLSGPAVKQLNSNYNTVQTVVSKQLQKLSDSIKSANKPKIIIK